jgi:hypothetical protein
MTFLYDKKMKKEVETKRRMQYKLLGEKLNPSKKKTL